MKLIDADETLMDAEHMSAFRCSLANMEDLNILIGGQETIDAVPVVRCRECKHLGFCGDATNLEVMGFYGYCSRGERKEGADNDT